MKRVSMRKISEVLRLHFKLNLSIRQSANATNTSRGSANNYCTRFKELNIDIDKFISLNEIEQERIFYPTAFKSITPQTSKVMPDYIYIQNELKRKKQTGLAISYEMDDWKRQYKCAEKKSGCYWLFDSTDVVFSFCDFSCEDICNGKWYLFN